MADDFMKVSSLEEILLAVGGTINIYKELKSKMEVEAGTIDGSLKLAIKFWSLSSTLSECIYQVSEHLREVTTRFNLRHAEVVNVGHPSVAKAEQAAKNDPDFINGKHKDAQRLQNYLDYLCAVKKDVDMAHYICKESYSRQTEIYLATYRNNQ